MSEPTAKTRLAVGWDNCPNLERMIKEMLDIRNKMLGCRRPPREFPSCFYNTNFEYFTLRTISLLNISLIKGKFKECLA